MPLNELMYMNWQQLMKPDKVQVTSSPSYCKFVCEPLERGFGITIGNSLRRVLKNYMPFTPLSLDITAEIIGIPPRTLQRYLKKSGLTYQEIIEQLRYEKALPLLQDNQQNILEIALELGYSDAAHFSRAFRRWAGMSPRDYRRQHAA